jgi:anti-sigma B factor antagonist
MLGGVIAFERSGEERLMDKQEFTVERSDGGDRTTVTVRGDVDLGTVNALGQALEQATREGGQVVIDMTDVTFLDSTGVRVLVEAYRSAQRHGGVLYVRGARHWVARVLEVTGVARLLSEPPVEVAESTQD